MSKEQLAGLVREWRSDIEEDTASGVDPNVIKMQRLCLERVEAILATLPEPGVVSEEYEEGQQPAAVAPVGDSMVQTALRNLPQYIGKSGLVGPDKHSALQCVETLRTALSKQRAVPEAKPNLDPVELHARGESASEWQQGYNEGWNACRQAMLAAAPSPEQESRNG